MRELVASKKSSLLRLELLRYPLACSFGNPFLFHNFTYHVKRATVAGLFPWALASLVSNLHRALNFSRLVTALQLSIFHVLLTHDVCECFLGSAFGIEEELFSKLPSIAQIRHRLSLPNRRLVIVTHVFTPSLASFAALAAFAFWYS